MFQISDIIEAAPTGPYADRQAIVCLKSNVFGTLLSR